MNADSVDKIVTRYFACLTREPFTFKERAYEPRPLAVSPLLLRGYTCPPGCGGCCHIRFTLDYLPSELRPAGLEPREIPFNGKKVRVYSDLQRENTENVCHHLNLEDGRCGVYKRRPFSCDFELIRTLEYTNRPNVLTQKLFGRGWNMKRIDGERGALCTMLPADEETTAEVVRKLGRLAQWAKHFGIRTWAETIVELIEKKRLRETVILGRSKKRRSGFFY